MSPTISTSPRRRELYTSRSNNKRDIDCGNGTQGKQSVDAWIERSRKKKPPRNNGDSGLKRTIACASCISVHARVCLFIRGTSKDFAARRNSGRGVQLTRTRHCFGKHRGKTRLGGTKMPFVAPRTLRRMQTVEKLTRAFVIVRFRLRWELYTSDKKEICKTFSSRKPT